MTRRRRPTRYRYVDFAAQAQPGFRNHVVTVDEVAALEGRAELRAASRRIVWTNALRSGASSWPATSITF